ncbi:DUF1611 domain-containing protein [Caldiplasma sukawensis]
MSNAVILAEGVLGNTYGKTANGLCRYSNRYVIKCVIDSTKKGQKIESIIKKAKPEIKIISTVDEAIKTGVDTLIVGVATDGGILPEKYRIYISEAIEKGINIVSGLHEFLSDDGEFSSLAREHNVKIIDVRKMFMMRRDFFTGEIFNVKSKKIAVLGTDSAIGKRTTAVYLNNQMISRGRKSLMIGTGQTAWMQGFEHTVVIDAMINDFIAGGIEKTIVDAYKSEKPEFMFLEGQGSVLHPAYPGSFEIIAAGKPDAIIIQHAPKRKYFDGFEPIEIPPLEKYIRILEMLSDRKVIGISINQENMTEEEVEEAMEKIERDTGIPAFNPLGDLGRMGDIIESVQ